MTPKSLLGARLPLALAVTAMPALAAGMDCAQAKTPTELAICAAPDLRQQDSDLSTVYGKLRAARPDQSDALRQAQRDWLKTRNLCAGDANCIRTQYDSRTNELHTQLRIATAYVPDDTDRLALEDLRQAVEAASQNDAEFPLENSLAALSVKSGVTTFSNVRDHEDDDEAHFPKKRPDGVTQDEWTALQASNIDAGGENGNASYTLIDLDGDGLRDLVINSYVGGTGLFSDISAVRRNGARFTAAAATPIPGFPHDDDDTVSELYTLNGRGSNQSGDWIQLRGRVYAAYRVSHYGVDHVYLLRPLRGVGEAPALTVQYRYQLSVPKQQKNEDKGTTRILDDTLHDALTQALTQINPEKIIAPAGNPKPLCPIPAGLPEDDRSQYYSYGPGHYAFEIVGDVGVRVGPRCYVAQLINWFGGYDAKNGLYAMMGMRAPNVDGEEDAFTVVGKRRAIGFDTSISRVENGSE